MHNIVLISKTHGSTSLSLVHGIFPSLQAVVKYIVRESKLPAESLNAMLISAKGWDNEDTETVCWEAVIPGVNATKHYWQASTQPLRDEEGN